jgi:catechol 2,3-dioxygenase-like lactoylglutathione lyase family enzyme
MPHFRKLTPNLLVADVSRSLSFYTDVLGFARGMTVPDEPPFLFASVTSGSVEVFFNEANNAVKEYPSLAGRPLGASGTMFIELEGIDAYYASLDGRVTVTMPIATQWYGMREFAIADPDGYLITFAERTEQP